MANEKVLSQCIVCRHGKWEGDPCPMEKYHNEIVKGLEIPTEKQQAERTEIQKKDDALTEKIYRDLRPYWDEENARKWASLIVDGWSGQYIKGEGYKTKGGLSVRILQKRYKII